MMRTIAGFICVLAAMPASAQTACPAATPLAAAVSAGSAPAIHPGQTVQLALQPAPQVRFAVPAHRPDDAKTYGGVLAVTVPATGAWRVGLGGGAWIEVVQDGKAVASVAHRHGDGCIVKMVDFPLQAGPAQIELSAASAPGLRLEVGPAD